MRRKILTVVLCLIQLPVTPGAFARRAGSLNGLNVTVGEPTVYSLEQAHYMLEKNRESNNRLQSAQPGPLDPNEINISQLNLLRTILSISAEYDQAAGITNKLSLQQYKDETTPRRKQLQDRQDAARIELTQTGKDLEDANSTKAGLVQGGADAKSPEMVDITAKIAALQTRQTTLTAEISSLETSLKELRAGPSLSGVTATAAPSELKDMLSKDALTAMMNRLGAGPGPSLAASVRLENYIQMQQELIAKQLTLLRDEAGPNSRVLFLEMPQSIFATGRAGGQIAQTWYRLAGVYTVHNPDECVELGAPADGEVQGCNSLPPLESEDIMFKVNGPASTPAEPAQAGAAAPGNQNQFRIRAEQTAQYQALEQKQAAAPADLASRSGTNNDPVVEPLRQAARTAVRDAAEAEKAWKNAIAHRNELQTHLAPTKKTRDQATVLFAAASNEFDRAMAVEGFAVGAESEPRKNVQRVQGNLQQASAKKTAREQAVTVAQNELTKALEQQAAATTKEQREQANRRVRDAREKVGTAQKSLQGAIRDEAAAQKQVAPAETQLAAVEKKTADARATRISANAEKEAKKQAFDDATLAADNAQAAFESAEAAVKATALTLELRQRVRGEKEILYRRVQTAFGASTAEGLLQDSIAKRADAALARQNAEVARKAADDAFLNAEAAEVVKAKEKAATKAETDATSRDNEAALARVLYERQVREVQGQYPIDQRPSPAADRRTVKYISTLDKHDKANLLSGTRTIDLVPKQSAFNVSALSGQFHQTRFSAVAKFLTLGLAGSYERNQETIRQFQYQQAFTWGFGKGGTSFGWTFGALPGTNQLSSGTRTTYAVVVVPRDTQLVELEGRGCWMGEDGAMPVKFPYDVVEPSLIDKSKVDFFGRPQIGDRVTNSDARCGGIQRFLVRVPGQQEGFALTKISYSTVDVGERTTVHLYGQGFSPQAQILVNGVALKRQTNLSDGVAGTVDGVDGSFEWVNSSEIAMSFSAGSKATKTPVITLVTPAKSAAINYYAGIQVNNTFQTSLQAHAKIYPMFKPKPEYQTAKLQPTGLDREKQMVQAYISGKGFHDTDSVLVNGKLLTPTVRTEPGNDEFRVASEQLLLLRFTRPDTPQWTITAQSKRYAGLSDAVSMDDPFPPQLGTCSVWNAAAADDGKRRIEIKFEGKYFNGKQKLVLKPATLDFTYRPAAADTSYGVLPTSENKAPFLGAFLQADGFVDTRLLSDCTGYKEALKDKDYANGTAVKPKP